MATLIQWNPFPCKISFQNSSDFRELNQLNLFFSRIAWLCFSRMLCFFLLDISKFIQLSFIKFYYVVYHIVKLTPLVPPFDPVDYFLLGVGGFH